VPADKAQDKQQNERCAQQDGHRSFCFIEAAYFLASFEMLLKIVSIQRSVLMKPVPHVFHSAGRPAALSCASVLPAAVSLRMKAVVSINMR